MFKQILVPLDGSARAEQALPVAAQIARATGASLVLLRVVTSPVDFAWYTFEAPQMMEQALDSDVANCENYLRAIAGSTNLASLEVITAAVPGEPALSIFAAARSYSADLIVMCSHGYTGFKRWMLGSIAQKVVRHSPIPVLVLRENAGQPTNLHPDGTRPVSIVVALDGSEHAETILKPAATLSAALSAPEPGILNLVHILSFPEGEWIGKAGSISQTKQHASENADAYMKQVEQKLQGGEFADLKLRVNKYIVQGADIADKLIGLAEIGEGTENIEGSSVIALATHGRSGPERWVLGSVTERVLHATRMPLLIVRPEKVVTYHAEKRQEASQSWVGLL